jgi:hypothetical protein
MIKPNIQEISIATLFVLHEYTQAKIHPKDESVSTGARASEDVSTKK